MPFEQIEKSYSPAQDHLRVSAAVPEVHIGNVAANVTEIEALYRRAANDSSSLVVFPELSVTGYSIGDLVLSPSLRESAKQGLEYLAKQTQGVNTAMLVGLPLQVGNGLYNVAALLADGQPKALIPKQSLPSYNQFYEKRWFQSWDNRENIEVFIGNTLVPFGRNVLIDINGTSVGVEICEDLWVNEPPHQKLAAQGALIVANPSASPENAGKSLYRRDLVRIASAASNLGYIYASAGPTESTADSVMSGHALISENGTILSERPALQQRPSLITQDIDIAHLRYDRTKNSNFDNARSYQSVTTNILPSQHDLIRPVDPSPFLPKGNAEQQSEQLETILQIQAHGLAGRLRNAPVKRVVLGLSGGLDSTLALLAALRASELLEIPVSKFIHTLTMPATASSHRTQSNAVQLAQILGVPNDEIPISHLVEQQQEALCHDGSEDVTYENIQARIRQALVFNKANQISGIALGTGDLTESMIGWCTYGGDQTSGYHVNSSVPKTLVKALVLHASEGLSNEARTIINDIVDTPISPELTGTGKELSQQTEAMVGPMELLDFFIYYTLRWQDSPRKIGFLALNAFGGTYSEPTIAFWLERFRERFYQSQWKRQVMPDGPRVGLSANPRGDLRLPPDINSNVPVMY